MELLALLIYLISQIGTQHAQQHKTTKHKKKCVLVVSLIFDNLFCHRNTHYLLQLLVLSCGEMIDVKSLAPLYL